MKTRRHFKISREDEDLGTIFAPFCITLDLSSSYTLPCWAPSLLSPFSCPCCRILRHSPPCPLEVLFPQFSLQPLLDVYFHDSKEAGCKILFPLSFFFIFPSLLSCPISPLAFTILSAQGCPQSRAELRGQAEGPGIKSNLGLRESQGGLKIARILEPQGTGFKFQLCQVLAGRL